MSDRARTTRPLARVAGVAAVAGVALIAAACGSSSPTASTTTPAGHATGSKGSTKTSKKSTTPDNATSTTTAPPTTTTAPPATTTTVAPPATTTTVAPPATTTTTSPAAQPKLLVLIGGQGAVEPTSFDLVQDGSQYVSGVTWSSWGAAGASGSGTLYVDSCTPSCAAGSQNPSAYAATVTLSAPSQSAQYGDVYTQMTITVPSDPAETQTYTLPR